MVVAAAEAVEEADLVKTVPAISAVVDAADFSSPLSGIVSLPTTAGRET